MNDYSKAAIQGGIGQALTTRYTPGPALPPPGDSVSSSPMGPRANFALDYTEQRLMDLAGYLNELEKAISSGLGSVGPDAAGRGNAVAPVYSPLVERIGNVNATIDQLICRVIGITSRVEL